MKYLIIALLLTATLAAQDKTSPVQEKSEFTAALRFREEFAKAVKDKKETPETVLGKLRAHRSPSGFKIDRDADFALAAIDVGQRLVAGGESEAAESFFLEADKSLGQAIKKTPDSAARDKAAFLEQRAYIRGRFLNRAEEAKADLEDAITLRPSEESLKSSLQRLRAENSRVFPAEKTKG